MNLLFEEGARPARAPYPHSFYCCREGKTLGILTYAKSYKRWLWCPFGSGEDVVLDSKLLSQYRLAQEEVKKLLRD